MPWPKTSEHAAQLGILGKGRDIKGLVVFNSWDVSALDLINGWPYVVIKLPRRYELYEITYVDAYICHASTLMSSIVTGNNGRCHNKNITWIIWPCLWK